MKKVVLSLIVALGLVGSSAQALEVGGLLGYRGNKLDFSQAGYGSSSTGAYSYGALVWFGFDILKIRTGLVATDRTSSYSTQAAGTTVDAKVTLNYFDIPINLEMGIPATSLYVFGGLYYGILGNQKCSVTNPTGSTCDTKVQTTNYGLNLGLGYDLIDLEIMKLSLEAFYEKGMGNIADGGNISITTEGYGFNVVGRAGF